MMRTLKELDVETVSEYEEFQEPPVTVFVCANSVRSGKAPTSAGRTRPTVPDFEWPFPVRQIVVPCVGRIQPEHILKAFESGADVVTLVACEGDNCHYIEGSARCTRRVEFVQSILEEIGLGEERLLLTLLPGSAAEDMLATAGKTAEAKNSESLDAKIAAVREHTVKALEILPPNPLRLIDAGDVPGRDFREGMETTDDTTKK